MATSKPTFVLIPGAWHTPAHFKHLIARLHEADYATASVALSSVNPPHPKEIEVATDVALIREKMLLPLLEEGKDLVLVLHSYGGFPGAAAAKGLSPSERRSEGRSGGIIGMIFMAAFLAPTGISLTDAVGGRLDTWITEETGYMNVSDPVSIFYADVAEPVASEACAELLPHAWSAFTTPGPPPAWADAAYSGRRAYIRCANDRAIPVFAQDLMVEGSGVAWVVKKFDCSHSPFLCQPAELAASFIELAEDFAKVRDGSRGSVREARDRQSSAPPQPSS